MSNLTKEMFEKLSDENISKKSYDAIVKLCHKAFSERFEKVCEYMQIKIRWYDYDNGSTENEINGHFDPVKYAEEIDVDGEFSTDNEDIIRHFPTRFLWMPWEDVCKELNDITKKNLVEQENRQAEMAKYVDSKMKKFFAKVEELKTKWDETNDLNNKDMAKLMNQTRSYLCDIH